MDRKRLNIYIMYVIAFLQGMVFYSSVSTLYRQAQGLTLVEMSIIESLFSIMVFIFEIPWGYVCDRIGYKKTMLICNGLYFISKIIFFKADSFFMFLLERIFLAIVISGLSGCDTALLYVSSEGQESTRIFGVSRAMGTSGLMIASCMCSLFIQDQYLKAALWTIYPYTIAFILTFFLQDVHMEKETSEKISLRDFPRFFFSMKTILLFLIAAALLTETTHTLGVFYNQLQYQRAHIPIVYLGIIYSIITLLCALSSALLGRIVKYIQEMKFIFLLYVIALISCFVLIMTTSPFLSVLMIAFLQISEALFFPMMDTILNQEVRVSRATTLSIYSMVMNATGIFTNLIFGKCAEISVIYAMIVGCVFCLIGFILYVIWARIQKNHFI